MSKFSSKFLLSIVTAVICSILLQLSATPAFAAQDALQMEFLDRGTVAVKSGTGVYLSWRLLGTEDYDTAFDVYRGNEKIATVSDSTNYTDTEAGTSYTVVPLGEPAASGKAVTVWDEQYITIPLDRPAGGTSLDGVEYTYSPNDVEPADVDGDGEYELILKWEPSNSFDSGKDAHHNGNVYIDCYEMDGTKLWRIDMGININAGAHFTQIAAYDFDLDGKAELAMKTAPGTKDGIGSYVSEASLIDEIKNTDNTADYRHGKNGADTGGRVLSGPEYYTVFQGDTGAALDTIYYPHPRGTVSEWGDDWGNRSERYLTAVAYLDGVRPSVIAWRGYYAKTTATAYNLIDKKFVQIADFDTSTDGNGRYAGNGNHNLTVGDVDNDGCDEIICGALALDDDLSVLWCSGRGHGDALHLADYDPTHEGMEYFSVHEDYSGSKIKGSTNGNDGKQHLGGMTLYDAETGEELFHEDGYGDTGRGMMANVGYGDGYFELWGAGNFVSYGDTNAEKGKYTPDSTNFRIFWDGDLYDELLDGTGGSDEGSQLKISDGGKKGRVMSIRNALTINGTKNNPCLQADLMGDWREELVVRGSDDASLLVYTTVIPTEHKLYTLMHDRAYRMQVASQNSAYNQPPHISYYISENNDERDMRKTAAYVSTVYNGETAVRSTNLPAFSFGFSIKAIGNQLKITNKRKQETNAVIYTAKYNGNILADVKMQNITIPENGYLSEISADIGDTLYLWDKDQRPLAKKAIVQALPTPKPTPSPTPTPTPKPTATTTPEFEVNNGKVTKYTGKDTTVEVPSVYNGETITGLARGSFNGNKTIEEVILPDSITEIEYSAFESCLALKKVTLPKNLTTISMATFSNCDSLTTINLENITSIGVGAFKGCKALEEITLGEVTLGDSAFLKCTNLKTVTVTGMNTDLSSAGIEPTTIYGYTGSKAEEYANRRGISFISLDEPIIPPTPTPTPEFEVTGNTMTAYNGTDKEVIIPETVNGVEIQEIINGAFLGNDIISVELPDTVTYLGNDAFSYCKSLKRVKLSNKMSSLGTCFEGCSELEYIQIPSTVEYIAGRAFADCPKVVIYGAKYSYAEEYAHGKGIEFVVDTSLPVLPEFDVEDGMLTKYRGEGGDITVPETVNGETVTSVLNTVFANNESIENIILPDTITEIGKRAFSGCTALKSIKLPSALEEVSRYMFEDCVNLKQINLPDGLVSICNGAFRNCTSLESIEIPDSVSYTEDVLFDGCTGLKNVKLPAGMKRIENNMFILCSALESVTLPESVESIGNGAFTGCEALASINLENVSNIDTYAFYDCKSLAELTFGANETQIGRNTFSGCTGLTKITVKNAKTMLTSVGLDNAEGLSIYGYIGSQAQYFADLNKIAFYNIETGEQVVREWVIDDTGKLMLYNGTGTDVVVPSQINGIDITIINDVAFEGSPVQSVELPNSITEVYYNAFLDCASLKSVKLSNSMTDVLGIFDGCTALESVYIPSSVTKIEENVFADCPKVVIHCAEGSAAKEYAVKYNISYVIDETLGN